MVPPGMGNQDMPMVAEFGHRISLRPKVACWYHFRKGMALAVPITVVVGYDMALRKIKWKGAGTFPIWLPVALWLSTPSSIGAEPKFTVASTSGTSAVSPV